jgi:hypothetical protein
MSKQTKYTRGRNHENRTETYLALIGGRSSLHAGGALKYYKDDDLN